jgi:hypothetical protein
MVDTRAEPKLSSGIVFDGHADTQPRLRYAALVARAAFGAQALGGRR